MTTPSLTTWREVESSNVEKVGWVAADAADVLPACLVVQYKGGAVYAYLGVSRQRAVACWRASSVGSYINRVIKPNFAAVRIA